MHTQKNYTNIRGNTETDAIHEDTKAVDARTRAQLLTREVVEEYFCYESLDAPTYSATPLKALKMRELC